MFITLTEVTNPRKPSSRRVRADQIQVFYQYDFTVIGEGARTVTRVEVAGRGASLMVTETVEQIEALLADSARPRDLARLLVSVWNLDMQEHLAPAPVAHFLGLTKAQLHDLYAQAQELAK